jgi:uncharacterized membrane protein YkvA (DUF1232 family)
MSRLTSLKNRANTLKRETLAIWYATRDNRTPWYARVLALLVAAYALSPVDLIPDFIPVIGYLDDLILIPAGIALCIRIIPTQVMVEARLEAERSLAKPTTWWMTALIILAWLAILVLVFWLIMPLFKKSK